MSTTGSGIATRPSMLALPWRTDSSDSVLLTTVVVKLSSSPGSLESALSNPARELTSIPPWFNLWIAFPVTGSRTFVETAAAVLSSPQTNALAASVLKTGDFVLSAGDERQCKYGKRDCELHVAP